MGSRVWELELATPHVTQRVRAEQRQLPESGEGEE